MKVYHDFLGPYENDIILDVIAHPEVRAWYPEKGWAGPTPGQVRGRLPLVKLDYRTIKSWLLQRAQELGTEEGILVLCGGSSADDETIQFFGVYHTPDDPSWANDAGYYQWHWAPSLLHPPTLWEHLGL